MCPTHSVQPDTKKMNMESEENVIAPPTTQLADRTGSKTDGTDHISGVGRPLNPLLGASVMSRLFFNWPYPLMRLGMQRPIEETDLPELCEVESSSNNLNMMERLWTAEKARAEREGVKPSLLRAIVKDFLTSIWYVQPLMFLSSTAKIVQAIALGLLLETFEAVDIRRKNEGYQWSAVIVICGAIILFEHHQVFFITWRKGLQLRIASVAAVYAKVLRLKSTAGTGAASSGNVINIASNDVERFLLAALFGSYLFWAPVQSLVILAVGLKMIGPAFAAGYGLLALLFVPLQFYLSQRFAKLRSRVAAITDTRVTLVSQAVAGVRVMKMSGWERQFEERITEIRSREINQIQRATRLKALNEAVFFAANVIVSITIFAVHVAIGGVLTPRNVYTTMTLVNIVQLEMTKHLSLAVMGVSECKVSIRRLQNFFEFPEHFPSSIQGCTEGNPSAAQSTTSFISVSKVCCYWNGVITKGASNKTFSDKPIKLIIALDNINLDLKKGQLTCIIGIVGCGKSALLQMLAGELEVSGGKVDRRYNKLAYAAQDPWLMDGSVRENITMGKQFREEWYNEVIAACGLTVDFEQFRNGDLTIVGDRGVQCSGGQRARIGESGEMGVT